MILTRSRSTRGFYSHIAVRACVNCISAVTLVCVVVGQEAIISKKCSAQDRRSPIVQRRVERVLRECAHSNGAAGIAFGMVQDGSAFLECYTGYASRGKEIRVSSSSVFNWASLSKGLTAVCALKMSESGRFNLDADVKEYVPELGLQVTVTLRQLLDQQGGVGGYADYPELMELSKLDRTLLTQQSILQKMAGKQTVFEPGSHQGYSSPGYILLSIAMERAAKKSFAEIVDEVVAKPLKLSSLRVGGISDDDVVAYRLINGKRERIDDTSQDWRLGAGAVKSTLPDALTFASALIQSSILKPESSRELFRRRAITKRAGDKGEVVGFTYGFMRVGSGPDAAITASGMQPGVRSLMIIYPRQQMASVIFANTTPLELESIMLKAMEAVGEK